MLTPNMLERATSEYRSGYVDAVYGKPEVNPHAPGTFGHRDYADGYAAGRCDAR